MNKKIILISVVLAVLVAAIIAFFVISGNKNTETPDDVSTPVTSEADDGNWTSIYDATLVE